MPSAFHILLVDDSDLIASRVPEIFHEYDNVTITIVRDPESARELLSTQNAQLVLLDISLNGSNGIDLLKQIKKAGLTVPVVMLTNQATRKHREICTVLGCYDFLDKTKEFDKLIPLVESLMGQR